MSQPRIAPINAVLEHPGLHPARLPSEWVRPDDQVFVVVTPGAFDGQRLATGDVLICRGHLEAGDTVVIASTGRGGARLGTFTESGVVGSAGELCSAARWRVVGRLFAVVPSQRAIAPEAPHVVPARRRPTVAGSRARWRQLARQRAQQRGQLSLFSAAA